jgi:hypothetical protein
VTAKAVAKANRLDAELLTAKGIINELMAVVHAAGDKMTEEERKKPMDYNTAIAWGVCQNYFKAEGDGSAASLVEGKEEIVAKLLQPYVKKLAEDAATKVTAAARSVKPIKTEIDDEDNSINN